MTRFGSNAGYIDDLHEQFLRDANSVSPAWREFFGDFERSSELDGDSLGSKQREEIATRPLAEPATTIAPTPPESTSGGQANGAETKPLIGAAAGIVKNMERSLGVPTATSVRTVPAKVLEENRRLVNQHREAEALSKVSFTHFIAWAVVEALKRHPALNAAFARIGDVPQRVSRAGIALGIAVDVEKSGSRSLVVPNIKNCQALTFAEFLDAYNELVLRARRGKLTQADFAETTISLTNPGMLGTTMSVPRLMEGQGAIIGIGAVSYPPECGGMTADTLAALGFSKVIQLTSTYDHRVIQGADSGEFLATVEALLRGAAGFYEQIFAVLGVPNEPIAWSSPGESAPTGAAAASRQLGSPAVTDPIRQARVLQLIHAYRVRGHLLARLNPLGGRPASRPELELYSYGLSVWDLDRQFLCDGVCGEREVATLREILDVLRSAYCQYSGIEYMYITQPEQRRWLQRRIENGVGEAPFSIAEKLQILGRLNAAEAFERFLGTSYVGHKRFSLEGCESLIPVMDALLEDCAHVAVEEVVVGMAHRGRLNVLATVIGKPLTQLFREFEDLDPDSTQGSGDVKYHLGANGKFRSSTGAEVQLTLASNPSHLESVNPVVEGMVRAKQATIGDRDHQRVIAVLIHGDAAFAGQGVVAETLNLSQLQGYRTGGTVHIVINNQIGFTTSPEDARSTHYATDIARSISAPVFHVNADHPQMAVRAMQRAFAFRCAFKCDVVVELVGYRRWGHNEADEPALTQPLMYEQIRKHRSVRKLATDRLLARGEIDVSTAEKVLEDFLARLNNAYTEVRGIKERAPAARPQPDLEEFEGLAKPSTPTAVARVQLEEVLSGHSRLPAGFQPHPKLVKILDARQQAFERDAIDWGLAESLAFGTLLLDGTAVRLSGEDSGRGTFNQRHATFYDAATGAKLIPLAQLSPSQAPFAVYDSLLSEFAVLGFEYGYSVVRPDDLVLWEAQFGDFANGAQVIIDQYLASGEEKWGQKCALVLLLPHGYEGQGPEHSSARLERFLQLASEGNIQVVCPTTPAQYFHVLRRQVMGRTRKPLIVMAPKSLLRLPAAVSKVSAFTSGAFQEVLADQWLADPARVERVLISSGKICYELAAKRTAVGADRVSTVALVRLEQLYPFPELQLRELLEQFQNAREFFWVQEEPRNMGGWSFISSRLARALPVGATLEYVGRATSASPASGSHARHLAEQEQILELALAPATGGTADRPRRGARGQGSQISGAFVERDS
ncbi:MAG: multifunctional oxoglutarate decarboxylase/oxoglutarate dehydrogenase thiamine pyrophosphate-binding subunit/dihydrolipoyllysine-residue succinyltransferase subunit [Planctomycetota bacterium]